MNIDGLFQLLKECEILNESGMSSLKLHSGIKNHSFNLYFNELNIKSATMANYIPARAFISVDNYEHKKLIRFSCIKPDAYFEVVPTKENNYLCSIELSNKIEKPYYEKEYYIEKISEETVIEELKYIVKSMNTIFHKAYSIMCLVTENNEEVYKQIDVYKQKIDSIEKQLESAKDDLKSFKLKVCEMINKKVNINEDFNER